MIITIRAINGGTLDLHRLEDSYWFPENQKRGYDEDFCREHEKEQIEKQHLKNLSEIRV